MSRYDKPTSPWHALWRRTLRVARKGIDALRARARGDVSCGEGCYTLNDGTLVPLGDLGVTPTEYRLRE